MELDIQRNLSFKEKLFFVGELEIKILRLQCLAMIDREAG